MQKRILIVSQEISPYTEEGHLGNDILDLAKIVKQNKNAEWYDRYPLLLAKTKCTEYCLINMVI